VLPRFQGMKGEPLLLGTTLFKKTPLTPEDKVTTVLRKVENTAPDPRRLESIVYKKCYLA
jgi:hypothetical protein